MANPTSPSVDSSRLSPLERLVIVQEVAARVCAGQGAFVRIASAQPLLV
jgi:hypothetical protein